MKRLLFLAACIFLTTGGAFAWSYSTQTSWNGTVWVDSSINFTPQSTAIEVRMDAPDYSVQEDCSQDPVVTCTKWDAIAKVRQGTTNIIAQRRNGGCAKSSGTVSTGQQAALTASLSWLCSGNGNCTEQQLWGPVKGKAGTLLGDCPGTSPGGQ